MIAAPCHLAAAPAASAPPRVVTSHLPQADPMRGAVLMLGNFDGFHIGHRSLATSSAIRAKGRPIAVMSCEPHPRSFFKAETEPFRLTTPDTKLAVFAQQDISYVFEPEFNQSFANLSPAQFADDVLAGGLGVAHIVAGPDFRFGSKRAGDVSLLRQLGRSLGFDVTVVETIETKGERVSSTRIRRLIRNGDVESASRLLGGDWIVEARRGKDGALYLHPSLCRPAEGKYETCLLRPGKPQSLEVEILPDGRVLPRAPLLIGEKAFFSLSRRLCR